ncbi:hypothetical protein BCR42DRAFT_400245 [Absidia repens]|uniref:Uncharacterized protein n=1 Tax=Absidia repens TaxID=90262 RepID=A0A1X2J0X7_9FUNG|nr:hypothetical protein BCR42DRAFT_400245 [Absidia repens]
MVSQVTQIIIAVLIIPCIPLLIYVIGILIPESHIVSRTITYKTRPERLWQLLTDVQQYPTWRPKLETVSIDSTTPATLDEGKRVVFVEHSKRHRRTVILHVEQQPMKTMLRVLEERITTAVSLRSPVPTRPHVPTFSGSWTFELKYHNQKLRRSSSSNSSSGSGSTSNNSSDDANNTNTTDVQLKITEQGVIKKPLVRLSNMLLFGYHRRIDRFMKDLEKRIEQDHQQLTDNDDDDDDQDKALLDKDYSNTSSTTTGDGHTTIDENDKTDRPQFKSADNSAFCNETYQQATTAEATLSLLTNDLLNKDLDGTGLNQDDQSNGSRMVTGQRQSTLTKSSSTKVLDKDWDLVSEIYERQKA